MNGQLDATTALPLGKWAPYLVPGFGDEKNPFCLLRLETRFLGLPFRSLVKLPLQRNRHQVMLTKYWMVIILNKLCDKH